MTSGSSASVPLPRLHPRAVASYVVIVVSLVLLLLPVLWMVLTAFKTTDEVFRVPPTIWPSEANWKPIAYAFSGSLPRFFLNSIIIAACTAVVTTVVGALTGYGISRARHWSTSALLMFFLASMAFPLPLLMISIYYLLSVLQLLNTYAAVIIGHMLLTLPIVVWLTKGFIDDLPVEVEQSAYIDGAGPLRILFDMVLPMMRPGLAAAGLYVFVTSWNEFVFGLSFTSSTEMRPLPAGISLLFLQEFQYQWPEMMAVATVATLPILLLFLAFQNQFVEGVTAGAVKH
ncbi:carbohydrate ABC transporter permease [Mesorhizobium sp. BAC0120]|uniref:carbohydrate ABC transporter permease n=1 Tax=Mesorhizobium sp. BAC0120 TaxID=3090670 RepID=UPI00298BD04D|nr:carbohydrate ABC transporter permease [Mesorhizobium sp. BAC0120]MDW6021621.1 carbohydrate ABC transporter permease [Mesorhizobium sp. BAC0120]